MYSWLLAIYVYYLDVIYLYNSEYNVSVEAITNISSCTVQSQW